MKLAACLCLLIPAAPTCAQSLAGLWQGAEDPEAGRYYPSVLRVQRGQGEGLFGILYEEVGPQPRTTVTFQVQGTRTSNGLKLDRMRKLNETGWTPGSYWCEGSISFTYDPALEKLTGHATYEQLGNCDTGEFIFYRVKLKSAATVKAGVLSTLRVSGREVQWYADAACKQLVASGNSYATRLAKTTTFYLRQGFFPSAESQAVAITIAVAGKSKATPPVAARPAPTPLAAVPAPLLAPDSASVLPPAVVAPVLPTGNAPLVLPTVLFKQSTPELLPSAYEALNKLAAALRNQPAVRLRIVGHTDRLAQDDPAKNQELSEQRAAAVKAYLVKAGVTAERLETAGYGDTRRLHPSPDVRNRRVEVERLP